MPNSISDEPNHEIPSGEAPTEAVSESAGTVAAAVAATEAALAEAEAEIQSSEDRVIDAVTASQQEVIETMEAAGEVVAMTIEVARRELVDFVAERIRRDLDTQQALLRCRSMRELRGIQFDYLRGAVDQYGGEASRLMRLGAAIASRSLSRPE